MPDDGARVDAGDLSVVIPYRADVPARRENLAAVLRHLDLTCGRLEILLIEDGPTPDGANLPRVAGLRHIGRHNTGFFHRTRLLNEGVETLATRRFAASFDTDALLYPQALAAGLERLRAGAGLVYPFDGRFINLRGAARARLLRDGALPEATTLPAQRRRWWHRPAWTPSWRSRAVPWQEGTAASPRPRRSHARLRTRQAPHGRSAYRPARRARRAGSLGAAARSARGVRGRRFRGSRL